MTEFADQIIQIRRQLAEIEDQLNQADVFKNQGKVRDLNRSHARLSEILALHRRFENVTGELRDIQTMLHDADPAMVEMAEQDRPRLEQEAEALERQIMMALIPPDPKDSKNTIMEIRAGTGGEEAALFAAALLRMYSRYAERQGWEIETLSINETGLGGIKEIIFSIIGQEVYSRLKYESGAHRVQRVPETEQQGRIHTSAVTVAVLPEAEEVDLHIRNEDLKIDTYRASGAGGQHVNRTESAVRITHVPTGLVVTCQDEKSQIKNRIKAMKVLRARLYEMEVNRQAEERGAMRKQQVGSGDRSERIRTYNFPQNRLTDHRINLTLYKLELIMEGDLDDVIDALREKDMMARLEALKAGA